MPANLCGALPDGAFNAINQAIDDFIFGGDYSNQCAAAYFPVERPVLQCAAYRARLQHFAPSGVAPSLRVTDMAGVFLVQLGAAALALLYCGGKLAARRLGHDAFHRDVAAPLKRRRSEAMRAALQDEVAEAAAAAVDNPLRCSSEEQRHNALVGLPVWLAEELPKPAPPRDDSAAAGGGEDRRGCAA